jgi:hypothetical protein
VPGPVPDPGVESKNGTEGRGKTPTESKETKIGTECADIKVTDTGSVPSWTNMCPATVGGITGTAIALDGDSTKVKTMKAKEKTKPNPHLNKLFITCPPLKLAMYSRSVKNPTVWVSYTFFPIIATFFIFLLFIFVKEISKICTII